VVDFKNTLIIMTSNIQYQFRDAPQIGFIKSDDEIKHYHQNQVNKIMPELLKYFKIEFLNRIDEFVFFNPLGPQEVREIVELQLSEVKESLAENNIEIEWTKNLVDFLAETGYNPELGARPLRRTIQMYVEKPSG